MSSRIPNYKLHDYGGRQGQSREASGSKFCSSDGMLNHVKMIGSMAVSHLVSRLMEREGSMRTTEFAHQVIVRLVGLRVVRS